MSRKRTKITKKAFDTALMGVLNKIFTRNQAMYIEGLTGRIKSLEEQLREAGILIEEIMKEKGDG